MKAVQGFGIGAVVTMISAGAWLGCSSSTTTTTADGGTEAGATDGSTKPTDGGASDTSVKTSAEAAAADSSTEAAAAADSGPVHWPAVWTDVVDVHCIGCHEPNPDGGSSAGGFGGFTIGKLDLSSIDAGYANLVGVPAQGTATFVDGGVACEVLGDAGPDAAGSVRVVAGDPGASLLYLKVHGFTTAPPCGSPMPINGEIPDGGQAAVVQEIAAWIEAGALP